MKKAFVALVSVALACSALFANGAKESRPAKQKIRVLSMTAQISDGIQEYLA